MLMPGKCWAYACRATYDSEKINAENPGKKLSVYRLLTDTEEIRKWI